MLNKLFANPEKALHKLANIAFWIWVIAGVIFGFMLYNGVDDIILFIPLGAVIGFVIGWLNGLIIHLFASIAENLQNINKNVCSIADITGKNN